ncbi:MAG: NAD(P)-binding domain-containing protein [Acidimicrobiaceae bacterium]|nr:NAD(P)-binding domain-containing protein [Acidimicrobiaceae bacterium]
MDVGFIGLGNIGGPCAGHLVEAGHRVTVFDVDEAAAGRLAQAGARAAASAAEVAGITEIIDTAIVRRWTAARL